jgi:DNA-binding MarR family transcriptional regulator
MPPSPSRHGPDHPAAAAAALLETAPLVSRWTERLLAQAQPPLTVSQYLALHAIADEPRIDDSLTAADLARRAGVSGPAVSQLLATLVEAGWIERHEALVDRRRQDVSVTEAGKGALQSANAVLTAQLAELLADVPAPELDALVRVLPEVRAALAGTPPPRRPRPPGPPRPPARPPSPPAPRDRQPAGPPPGPLR